MPENDDKTPINVSGTITDFFGVGKVAEILTAALAKGLGNLAAPWLHRRYNTAQIEAIKDWQAALQLGNQQLAEGEITLTDRAEVRLKIEKVQEQANREAIAFHVIDQAKRIYDTDGIDANEPPEAPEPEWLSRYWRLANDISTEDFQALWGKILARKITGKSKIGARTLDFISTLSRDEAASLEQMAACVYRTMSPDRMGLIFRFPDNIPETTDPTVDERLLGYLQEKGLINSNFGAMGIFIEMWTAQGARIKLGEGNESLWFGRQRFRIGWGEPRVYNLSARHEGYISLGSGYELTTLGKEIISLVDRPADQTYLDLLREGFTALGIKFEPW